MALEQHPCKNKVPCVFYLDSSLPALSIFFHLHLGCSVPGLTAVAFWDHQASNLVYSMWILTPFFSSHVTHFFVQRTKDKSGSVFEKKTGFVCVIGTVPAIQQQLLVC